jgi:hypothetical protein
MTPSAPTATRSRATIASNLPPNPLAAPALMVQGKEHRGERVEVVFDGRKKQKKSHNVEGEDG